MSINENDKPLPKKIVEEEQTNDSALEPLVIEKKEDLNDEQHQPERKPKWLLDLEQQSWQAELLISGLVIFSLFGLPAKMIHWIEYYTVHYSQSFYLPIHVCTLYLLSIVYAVTFLFLAHFAIRSLWIALLGLNSVYPEGIQINAYNLYTKGVMKYIKEEFNEIETFCEKLENISSLIFSIAALIVMIFTASIFSIVISWSIYHIFSLIVPLKLSNNAVIWFLVFVIIVLLIQLLWATALKKKVKGASRTEYTYYKCNRIIQRISFNVFYWPLNYIMHTLLSNAKYKSQYLNAFVTLCSIGVLFRVITMMNMSPILSSFNYKNYFNINNNPNEQLIYNYDNLHPKDQVIFTPTIQADIITGKTLKVFLPLVGREELARQTLYGKLSEKKLGKENYQQKTLAQHQQFNTISINGEVYKDLRFRFYSHPNKNEKGLLTYIPTKKIKIGENILEIKKEYYYQDTLQKTVVIPFYFEGGLKTLR